MGQSAISIKDYYELIKEDAKVINLKIELINEDIKALSQPSSIRKEKNYEVVKTNLTKLDEISNSNVKLINVLKAIFGDKFFDTVTEEELKKANEKGLFTIESLDGFIGKIYGNNYGYEFKRPTSWQEFADFIKKCIKLKFL